MKFWWLVVLVCACSLPTPKRPTALYPAKPLAGIRVDIEPSGDVGFVLRVENQRGDQIDLVWDESSFVDANDVSWGRLVRGQTRVIDEAKPQSITPIAARATMIEWFVPEFLADYKPGDGWRSQRDPSKWNPAPPAVTKGVGRLILVFDSPSGRETWIGRLEFGAQHGPPSPNDDDHGAAAPPITKPTPPAAPSSPVPTGPPAPQAAPAASP